MMNKTILQKIKIYTHALHEIAKNDDKLITLEEEIACLQTIINENKIFLKLLQSKFLSINNRYCIIDDIFSQFSTITTNFLKILIKNNCLKKYNFIFDYFLNLCHKQKKILSGIVYSTIPLDKQQLCKLETTLSNLKENYYWQIKLINKIDLSLIGGIKIIINNHIYDYSIQNEINLLSNKMRQNND